ncbi:MAG: PIN domain-containing protein [Acidobacteria bacterium]|nr:PIN domain-containing protein [Acidobacteriota bacterium]
MRLAYVDTSCLVAIAAKERGSEAVARDLSSFERLFSSNLLEAELRAVLLREKIAEDPAPLLDAITWVYPDRRLTPELQLILDHGHLRGADLWHLACALFIAAERPGKLAFFTLDRGQRKLASSLGFQIS